MVISQKVPDLHLTEQPYMVHVHFHTPISLIDRSIPSPREVLRVKLTATGAQLLIYKTLPINWPSKTHKLCHLSEHVAHQTVTFADSSDRIISVSRYAKEGSN